MAINWDVAATAATAGCLCKNKRYSEIDTYCSGGDPCVCGAEMSDLNLAQVDEDAVTKEYKYDAYIDVTLSGGG